MRHTTPAPTLRDLHANRAAPAPVRRPKRFWEEDPDLAPPARPEAPLSCWT